MTLQPPTDHATVVHMETNKYRTNADGSAACHHRDLTVCTNCATHPHIVEVFGAHYYLPDPADREALAEDMAMCAAEATL